MQSYKISYHASLKELNTFGVEAEAACVVELSTGISILEFLSERENFPEPILIIGGGSNILFTGQFEGTIALMRNTGIIIKGKDEERMIVNAAGGENWNDLVDFCISHDLGGLENLSGIPGLVGASPVQNIGAYGVEVCESIQAVHTIDLKNGIERTYSASECNFGYRSSIFKNEEKGRKIITSVDFCLNRHHKLQTEYGTIKEELNSMGITSPTIKNIAEAVLRIRSAKLPDPLELGNAGSFFRNPIVSREISESIRSAFPEIPNYPQTDGSFKLAAGWMIEKAGWKGFREGNTGVHDQQALILVNYGGASGTEILDLASRIQNSVHERFGLKLEPEVNIIQSTKKAPSK